MNTIGIGLYGIEWIIFCKIDGFVGGEVKDVLLLDVTPLTLSIETLGRVSTPLIERNTTIPTKKAEVSSTAEDNQNAVTIRVFQGEREMAADNKLLGQFNLEDIPPAPRGMPQIEVTFDIDANGILDVKAADKATSREQSVRITASSMLSNEDVDRMVKEAQEHAAEDKAKRESVEQRNQADALAFQAERTIKELGDKVSAEDKAELAAMIEDYRNEILPLIVPLTLDRPPRRGRADTGTSAMRGPPLRRRFAHLTIISTVQP